MSRDKPIKKKTKSREDKPGKGVKDKKPDNKRPKVVRDSFTMPVSDYEQLKALKKSCLALGVNIKKGELLRAGIMSLAAMGNSELLALLAEVEKIKTGRPANDKDKDPSSEDSR